ncbi:MAG: L-2-hydroxyglutarate oxidase, partial [Bacteroidota bacterium]
EIPYDLCGKVIVATDESEIPALNNIYERGNQNGLNGLKKISADELHEIEPHVNGVEAIFVPQTGIIDYKRVANKYGEIVKHFSGEIFVDNKVLKIKKNKNNNLLTVVTNNQTFTTRLVVNCAGLYSDQIAKMMGDQLPYRIVPFRGEYYKLKEEKKHLVKNLIYPVPDPAFPFLGVHFTRMIDGAVEAGPNAVLAFQREGYSKSQINIKELGGTLAWPGFQKVAYKYWRTGFGEMYRSFSKAAFTKALQKLMPEIEKSDLVPGGAGVRAQACDKTGGLIDDFLISEGDSYINVCNAPSPAATSSLSIGETVSKLILKRF